MDSQTAFPADLLDALRSLVNQHHLFYPRIPPPNVLFESLVERAFKNVSIPFRPIERTARNAPKHDLGIGNARISVKSETGEGTKPHLINITKLCTTERNPWQARTLIARAIEHLSEYELILMLRAARNLPVIHYQVVEIPSQIPRRIEGTALVGVGKRKRRRGLGADVADDHGGILFHVHFHPPRMGSATYANDLWPIADC
ncbi:MAG: hypothetical protein ACHQZQ_00355 [SAR324 cluster bacterium]